MTDRAHALTPDALLMMDTIARTGSFAAAARELGKVPSALTYSVRQLEDALDVLLFDRSSRQAQLTAAGEELLHEGRRLLLEIDAVANRVRRVACGWETQLTVAADGVISRLTLFELCEAFYATGAPTRLRLRAETLSGTLEALQTELQLAFPGLQVSFAYSPPFRELSDSEDESICARIEQSGVGLLFVSLGCPKQEFWMATHRGRLPCVMLGVGAAFEFHAGQVGRAPHWMRDHGLEWLHRLASQPGRLWRRYAYTNSWFLARSAGEALRSLTVRLRIGGRSAVPPRS